MRAVRAAEPPSAKINGPIVCTWPARSCRHGNVCLLRWISGCKPADAQPLATHHAFLAITARPAGGSTGPLRLRVPPPLSARSLSPSRRVQGASAMATEDRDDRGPAEPERTIEFAQSQQHHGDPPRRDCFRRRAIVRLLRSARSLGHGCSNRGNRVAVTAEVCAPHNRRLLTDDRRLATVRLPHGRPNGERSATVNAGFWVLVRMRKIARGRTSFRPSAILGANTTPCSSPRTS